MAKYPENPNFDNSNHRELSEKVTLAVVLTCCGSIQLGNVGYGMGEMGETAGPWHLEVTVERAAIDKGPRIGFFQSLTQGGLFESRGGTSKNCNF